jgi:predicted DsbA family dithiol-disulfide isomerase
LIHEGAHAYRALIVKMENMPDRGTLPVDGVTAASKRSRRQHFGGAVHITIDIVSDAVCPWCFIGKRRLEQALATLPQMQAAITWRPFQLDPTIPVGGLDRGLYLQNKFGSVERVEAIHQRLAAAGSAEGVPFHFDKIKRSPNTLDAHRLIRWSQTMGVQNAVVEQLFHRYFVDGCDIGDRQVLCGIAEQSGLDAALVGRLLDEGADHGAVVAEIDAARQLGISGVPTFIFAGRYAVSGAQPAPALAAAISQAVESGSDRPIENPPTG